MKLTGEGYERQGTAVVVGASLSGLMTGLALSRAGVGVTMLERVDEFPRTGASLGWVVDEGLIERITRRRRSNRDSATSGPSVPPVQTWTAVHAGYVRLSMTIPTSSFATTHPCRASTGTPVQHG
jgi:hypothetical protein